MQMPTDILEKLERGEWTVSYSGKPYHNLGLDEAHQCIINNGLKQITSRPSYFRTVELANVMAYLDKDLRIL